jgi:hypothetical protein
MRRGRVARAGIQTGRFVIAVLIVIAVVLLYLTVFTRAGIWN